jgi:hypothetical protein
MSNEVNSEQRLFANRYSLLTTSTATASACCVALSRIGTSTTASVAIQTSRAP